MDTGEPQNWAVAGRPSSVRIGVYLCDRGMTPRGTETEMVGGWGDEHAAHRAREGRRSGRVPRTGRALPGGTARPLLPDPRIGPGRRGRPAGDAARGVARARGLRGARLRPHLALLGGHQPRPEHAPGG